MKFLFLLFIWRFGLMVWRIPTFGPIIIGVIVLAVAAAGVMRAAGAGPWRRRGGTFGQGSGNGPRDW